MQYNNTYNFISFHLKYTQRICNNLQKIRRRNHRVFCFCPPTLFTLGINLIRCEYAFFGRSELKNTWVISAVSPHILCFPLRYKGVEYALRNCVCLRYFWSHRSSRGTVKTSSTSFGFNLKLFVVSSSFKCPEIKYNLKILKQGHFCIFLNPPRMEIFYNWGH